MRLIYFFITILVLFNLFTSRALAVGVGGRIYYEFGGLNIGLEKVAVFMEEIPSGITVYPDYKAFISQWETPRSYSDISGTVVLTDGNGYYRFDASNPCYKLTLDKALDIKNLITDNQVTPTYGNNCEFKNQGNIQYQRFASFFPYNYDRSNINSSIFFEPNEPGDKILKGGGTWKIVGNWVGATPEEYGIIRENSYISILEAFVGWGILQASNWESYMAKTKQSAGFINGIDFQWLPADFGQPVAKLGNVYCQDQSSSENKSNYIRGVDVSTENYNLYYFYNNQFPSESKTTDWLGSFTLDDMRKHWGIGIRNPTLRNSVFFYDGAEYQLIDAFDKGLLNNNYFSTSDKSPLIHLAKQGSTHEPSGNPIYTFFLNNGREILNYDTGVGDAAVSHFGYIGYAPYEEGPGTTLPLFLIYCHIGCGGYTTRIQTTNIDEVPNEYRSGQVAPREYMIQPTKNNANWHAYTFNIGYDQVGPWHCSGCERHIPVNNSMGNDGVTGWIYNSNAPDRKPLYRKSKQYGSAVYYAVTPNDGNEFLNGNWYTGSTLLGYIDKYDNYKIDIGVDNCCVRPNITVHYPEANSQLDNTVYISGSSQMKNFNVCKRALDNPDTVKIKIIASDGGILTTDCNINTVTGDTANFICNPDDNFFVNGNTYNYEITADNGALDSIYTNNFSINLLKSAWWQTCGGDIFSQGPILSKIPDSCQSLSLCNPYLMLDCSANNRQHGIVIQPSLNISLGDKSFPEDLAQPADQDWYAPVGAYAGQIYNYAFWQGHLTNKIGIDSISDVLLNSDGVYQRTGPLTINNDLVNISGKIVILVDGSVDINGNITVAKNISGSANSGSIVIISSGNINIANTVTEIEGFYIANGKITALENESPNSDQLHVYGGLISFSDIDFLRDYNKPGQSGGIEKGNNFNPAEYIEWAPDIFMNLHPDLKIKNIRKWKEVAP